MAVHCRSLKAFLIRGALFFVLVTGVSQADRELIIVSPHWEGIQFEFGRAFEEYYKEKTGTAVRVRWRDLGGTSKIKKALNADYETSDSSGNDIFFGGGVDAYNDQKERGHLISYKLPPEVMLQVPIKVGSFPIVDEDFAYYGAALSSFGILTNQRVKERVGLPEVKRWADLARPELLSWVSSGDPRKSGSIHMIYEIILQSKGWDRGWEIIYPFSANVRAFEQSSSAAAKKVSAGDAGFAIAIDINGMTQQAFIGKENVSFSLPIGETVINPDSIAILKGAPNLEMAKEFMNFVMSERGQSLWMIPRGEKYGPVKFDISRMAVLEKFYQRDTKDLLVPINPFEETGIDYDSKKGSRRWGVVNTLMGSTMIDVHPHLVRTWKSILEVPEGPGRVALIREFSRCPITEEEADALGAKWRNKSFVRAQANRWMQESVERYAEIREKAKRLK